MVIRRLILAVVTALALAGAVTSCAPQAAAQAVTLDGNDGTGMVVDPINIWDNYQTRSKIVARLHHGDHAMLVRRDGNGVLIETAAGVQGWVSAQFIKEMK